MRRLGKFIALGVFALMVASCVPVSRLGHTCVVCRLARVDLTCLGLTRATYRENECSRWYAAHVDPAHTHTWERGTCCYVGNLLGMPIGFGCRPGHFPIHRLDPTTQMRVYQHFQDPLVAKRLFEGLADEKTQDDRLEEDFESRGDLTVRALQEWEAEDFPGTWEEWWSRFDARHIEEHKEWLTWFHAESNMSFWDWRKQRKTGE